MAVVKEQTKTFPLRFQDSTINANYRSEYMRCLKNVTQLTSDNTYSIVTSSGLIGCQGSVLSPNGTDVYFCPNSTTQIGKYDTLTGTMTLLTAFVGNVRNYQGGVLAPNGFIYMVPATKTSILKLDPSNDTYVEFGSFVGANKWSGAVCTQDGIIYAFTNSATQILKIDTNTDTTSLIGTSIQGYNSGCIAPNGKIYFSPVGKNTVLVLDPATDLTSTISISVSSTWYGAVLLDNGCIYSFPYNHTNGALKIDTNTDITSLIVGIGGTSKYYQSAQIGSDGFAYGIPFLSVDLACINPADDSITVVETAANLSPNQYIGASLASDGVIYCSPRANGTILKIGTNRGVNKEFPLSNFNNKV